MNNSSWFWPDVSNVEEAKKACRVAMWCAIFVASVTTLFSLLALAGTKIANLPIDASALFDAANEDLYQRYYDSSRLQSLRFVEAADGVA